MSSLSVPTRFLRKHLFFRLCRPSVNTQLNLLPSSRRRIQTTPHDNLFNYTSGRFLYNEPLRLRERYVKFDPDLMKTILEQHTGLSRGRLTQLSKLAEGGYNRVFSAIFEDDSQLIVKVPYPLTVPKHYTTASEVATLDFLGSKGIPVPRVLGSSSTTENALGIEYILMEPASGVGLDSKWFDLGKKKGELPELMKSLVGIEKLVFEIPFGSLGSLYYKKDIPLHLQGPLYMAGTLDESGDADRFCIGPISDPMFWYGRRANLEVNRGPWNDTPSFLSSVGQKELEWTRRYGKPCEFTFPHNTFLPGKISPTDYMQLLEKYLALAPHLLPADLDTPSSRPTLRHPDMTPSNIFVHPDTCQVATIIDWQHTMILPYSLVAGYPRMFENPDPELPKLEKPSLPSNFESLSRDAKEHAEELHRRRLIFYAYRVFNGGLNRPHLDAMRDPFLLLRQALIHTVGQQWSGNLVTLRDYLIKMVQNWPSLSSLRCPISFSASDLANHEEQEAEWCDLNAMVEYWRSNELYGLNEEGWLRTEVYDDAVARNQELYQDFLSKAEDEEDVRQLREGWPFKDREEIW